MWPEGKHPVREESRCNILHKWNFLTYIYFWTSKIPDHCAYKWISQVLLWDAETSGLCAASAPPWPALHYSMVTTDLLLVSTEYGHTVEELLISFAVPPDDRKTYYLPSPWRGCGGRGLIMTGVVIQDNRQKINIAWRKWISAGVYLSSTTFHSGSKIPVHLMGKTVQHLYVLMG